MKESFMLTEEKVEHLKKLGLKGDFSEIEKLYNGKPFDSNDPMIKKLLSLSEKLCKEYDEALYQISVAKTDSEKEILKEKAAKILDDLFPGHKEFAGVCEGVRAVIGMVDCEQYVYINKSVHFAPFTNVKLGFNTLVAPFTVLGTMTERVSPQGLQKVEIIEFEGNNWVCAGANLANGVIVRNGAIVGLGAVVRSGQEVEANMFAVNDPSKAKFSLENYKEKEIENPRPQEEIDKIVKFVTSLGIKGDMTEYVNALNGKTYNTLDPVIGQICDLTHNLNREYNHKSTTQKRKQEILDILFFGHGKNLKVGKDLFVDFIGQTKVGGDVIIGDGCYFGGNIEIGNKCSIGSHNCFAGIGHPMQSTGRSLQMTEHGPYVASTIGSIKMPDNTKIGNHNLISPNVIVPMVEDAQKVLKKGAEDKFDKDAEYSFVNYGR